ANENTFKLWDLATHKVRATLEGHTNRVMGVAFSPDGKTLASASNNEIKVWDVAAGRAIDTLTQSGEVASVAFSPDGKFLALGGEGIRVWELAAKREAVILRGHRGNVTSVAFSPDGKALASGSGDGTAKLWDLGPGQES